MRQRTPAPWKADITKYFGKPASEQQVVVHNGDVSICTLAASRGHHEEAMPDALLIAAAPDLLDACKTFVEWLSREDEGWAKAGKSRDTPEGEAEWRQWYGDNLALCRLAQEQARGAIAKAEAKP